jgi:hypothetical protein
MMTAQHVRELKLRRYRAGEPLGPETSEIEAHTAACGQCRARLKELDDEQKRFQEEISFDRFAAGVERAGRTPSLVRPARRRAKVAWAFGVGATGAALAAGFALMLTFGAERGAGDSPTNRLKGGAGVTIRIAGAGSAPQRTASADAPEALSPGERLRIGYQPGGKRYLVSISVDDRGEITALYPEAGRSLPLGSARPPGQGPQYLPDSLELTGKGAERVVVVLSDQPLEVEAVKKAARAAFARAKGDLFRLPDLEIPGEQFHRTFLKP